MTTRPRYVETDRGRPAGAASVFRSQFDHAVLLTRFFDGAKPPFCASASLVAEDSAASCAAVSPSALRAGAEEFDDDSTLEAGVCETLETLLMGHLMVHLTTQSVCLAGLNN